MSKFGITERGDAGRDLSWVGKMGTVDMAVLITKTPTPEFLEAVVPFREKVVVHLTCTGFGGTKVEPNVFAPQQVFEAAQTLLRSGFKQDQIVLRLDPIILHAKWRGERERAVLKLFEGTLERCRFSFMDMYKHVSERFKEAYNGWVPYTSFHAPAQWMYKAYQFLDQFKYSYESCAETIPERSRYSDWDRDFTETGCISEIDTYILDMTYLDVEGNKGQRKGCLCPAGKTELLEWGKCPNGCIYCYWKHN